MKRLRKDKFRKILAFMVALALMVSCVPSAYTISASEAFGDGTDDLFTDGERSSEPEAEESTPDVSSADQEKQAQQTTLTYENDSVKVTAEAQEEGALPENTSLRADTVNENSSVSYDTVSQKLSKAAEDKGSSLRGFFAFDVYFADADGNRVEPNGRVKVTIEYKTPAAPELTDAANTGITVEKLRYNSSTGETEMNVLQPNEDLKVLNVTDAKQVQTIQVETGNAAVFAVMWDSPETVSSEDENSDTPISSEESNSDLDISDGEVTPEPEVTETPVEEPTVTEAPAEEPEVTETPAEEPTVTEAPAEEPEITQTPTEEAIVVTVIEDETNLRVSPSEEAEVIATLAAGTKLTVLETVTAEDGTTWYKVSYEETEAYVRSDLVQVVDEKETSEDEVTDLEQEGPVTYSKTVGNVIVTATADKGVLPEDAELVVTPIEKDNSQYSEVESQLNTKAEEENYTVAGFLAYDIYFQDSEGNKIEPNNGSVKVSMDYQASSIPEEIKESTETSTFSSESDEEISLDDENTGVTDAQGLSVAVMHLVEDKDGNVQSVVDMTQQGTAKVETTAENEIQKAEFETESFSVFTITWQGVQSGSLEVQLIDTEGKSIGDGDKAVAWSGDSHEVVYADAPKITGYAYKKAKVASTAGEKGAVVKHIRYINEKYQYTSDRKLNNATWYDIGSNTVYFVYQKVEDLTTVETIDHTSDGITMTMKDLWGNSSQLIGPSSDQSTWLNLGGPYGNGNIKRGLLNKVLASNGYPTVINSTTNLESLFSGGTTVNHLFLKSIYDQTGYYEYSSFNNYAYLGSNPGTTADFTVYDAIGTPANSTSYFYSRGNFMPYNAIKNGSYATNTHNLYDEDGNELDDDDPDKGKVLYKTQGSNNYQFSMEMDGNFLQPKDGKVTPPNSSTKESMIYEFNGDDDMWIYIDDVLVLDIGGVHDAHSGKINFDTGVVSWKDCNKGGIPKEFTTTIKAMFSSAGVFPDGTKWDDSKVDDYFDGDTFKDYTMHTFKMFYMERGAGASNLHMKFNIQVIPEGQVEVRKELGNTDKEKYTNVKFAFQLYAQKIVGHDAQDNEIYSDEYVPLCADSELGIDKVYGKPTNEEIKFSDEEIDGTTYKNVFWLKPDESAIFTGLQANRKYFVKEIGVKSSEYDQVTINGTTIKNEDGNEISSAEAPVESRPVIVFTNDCSAANLRELRITKQIKDNISVDDTFSFRVLLSNQNNVLVPYANGDYYLLKDGNYWYYDDSGVLTSNGTKEIVCGKTTEDGMITGVPAGYTVSIIHILSETSFQVEEVNLDSSKYYDNPEKEVTNADASEVTNSDGSIVADGSIRLGQNANVVVTNTPYSKIKVNKVWMNGTDSVTGTDSVYVGLYQKTDVLTPIADKYAELNPGNNYTAIFTQLDRNVEYVVKELRQIEKGEKPEFEINNVGYIQTDSTTKIGDHDYEISYSDLTTDSNDQTQKNVTVTNNRLGTISIIKVDGKDNSKLEGAEFKLQKKDEQGNFNDIPDKTETTDGNGRLTFDKLEPGIYKIIETKAPSGYTLSADDIVVEVGIGENKTFDIEQTITNNKIYNLPSAGGPGIYGFTISGVAILATALLLFINNKRREEEAKRP